MEVNGQIRTCAAFSPGKVVPIEKGLDGPQSRSQRYNKDKNLLFLLGFGP